jgi:hypothetical protein
MRARVQLVRESSSARPVGSSGRSAVAGRLPQRRQVPSFSRGRTQLQTGAGTGAAPETMTEGSVTCPVFQ